jgi:hypothetical protein
MALFEVSKDVRALAGILFQNTVQALSSMDWTIFR